MTATTVFQLHTGSAAQWGSSPSTALPVGVWEPGFALTPIEFEPESTAATELGEPVLDFAPEPALVPLEEPVDDSLPPLSLKHDRVLRELWDNPDDAEYDLHSEG